MKNIQTQYLPTLLNCNIDKRKSYRDQTNLSNTTWKLTTMKIFRIRQAWISDVFGETAQNKDKPNTQTLEVIAKVMGHMNQPSTLQYLNGVELAGVETTSAGKKPTLH